MVLMAKFSQSNVDILFSLFYFNLNVNKAEIIMKLYLL